VTVSGQAARLVADTPAIAVAHFAAEADPYHPQRNPDGYVNLGTAENRLTWDLLADRLRAPRSIGPADTRYGPLYGTEPMRTALAAFLTRTRGVPTGPQDLIVVSGATAALDIAATVLCDPGEAIAVPVPYYAALDTDLTARSHAVLLPIPPGPGDGLLPGAAAVAGAVTRARSRGVTVRVLAITSPHNPVGHVYSRADLAGYARVCAQLDLHLLADEIYANSTFPGTPFVSVRSLGPDLIDPGRVHSVWGFAKDFGLPGLKVGVLDTRSAPVRAAARELAYFAPVSTDTQRLLVDLLDDGAWVDGFLAAHRSRLAASYAATAGQLDAAAIPYRPAAAGLSLWLDMRRWLSDRDGGPHLAEAALWRRLFDTGRVSLMPGEIFHSAEPGWFRLCHATDPETVREGVRRLCRMLAARGAARSTTADSPSGHDR
jgi:1-aminocyclopropane-1-carboxylate synthase 1/2/6